MTAKDIKNIPPLYSQDGVKDPIVWVKFFNPRGGGTWFATEFDGKDTFFGYVMGLSPGGDELGYFSLREMKGSRLERDMHWKPMTLSKAKSAEKKLHGQSEMKEGSDDALKRAFNVLWATRAKLYSKGTGNWSDKDRKRDIKLGKDMAKIEQKVGEEGPWFPGD